MVNLRVESRAIGPIVCRCDQVVRGAECRVESALRVVFRSVRVVTEEVPYRGINARKGDLVIREWLAVPAVTSRRLTERVLTERGCRRIEYRVQTTEIEVACQ